MSSTGEILEAAEAAGISWGKSKPFEPSQIDAIKSHLYARTEFSCWFDGLEFMDASLVDPQTESGSIIDPRLPEHRVIRRWCSANNLPFDFASSLFFLGRNLSVHGHHYEIEMVKQLILATTELARLPLGVKDRELLTACQVYGSEMVPHVCVQVSNPLAILSSGKYINAHHINAMECDGIQSTGMQAGFTSTVIAEMRRYVETKAGIPKSLPEDISLLLRPSSGYILHSSCLNARDYSIMTIHGIGKTEYLRLPISLSAILSTGLVRNGHVKYGNDRMILKKSVNPRVMVYPGDATIDSFSGLPFFPMQDVLEGKSYDSFGDMFSILTCTKIGSFPNMRTSPFEFIHGQSAREYSEALILGSFDIDDIRAATINVADFGSANEPTNLSSLVSAVNAVVDYKEEHGIDIFIYDSNISVDEVEIQNKKMGKGWARLLSKRYGWTIPPSLATSPHPGDVLVAAVEDGIFPYCADAGIEHLRLSVERLKTIQT